MHMYFKICSKYSTRTSHRCYIAMAIVTDRKRIFIWSCLFLPKKLGLPHFLQGRVGIPALVPIFCLRAFPPCPFHRPFERAISSWMNRVVPHPLPPPLSLATPARSQHPVQAALSLWGNVRMVPGNPGVCLLRQDCGKWQGVQPALLAGLCPRPVSTSVVFLHVDSAHS